MPLAYSAAGEYPLRELVSGETQQLEHLVLAEGAGRGRDRHAAHTRDLVGVRSPPQEARRGAAKRLDHRAGNYWDGAPDRQERESADRDGGALPGRDA
jgi:hypothetical protein